MLISENGLYFSPCSVCPGFLSTVGVFPLKRCLLLECLAKSTCSPARPVTCVDGVLTTGFCSLLLAGMFRHLLSEILFYGGLLI